MEQITNQWFSFRDFYPSTYSKFPVIVMGELDGKPVYSLIEKFEKQTRKFIYKTDFGDMKVIDGLCWMYTNPPSFHNS